MLEVTDIPFHITVSEAAPFTFMDKVHVGKVSASDLGITLTAVGEHVEFLSPFGCGGTTVRYLREGLLGVNIVYDTRGAHHWPNLQPGAFSLHACWDCSSLGCSNSGCGGSGTCNGQTCPSS